MQFYNTGPTPLFNLHDRLEYEGEIELFLYMTNKQLSDWA